MEDKHSVIVENIQSDVVKVTGVKSEDVNRFVEEVQSRKMSPSDFLSVAGENGEGKKVVGVFPKSLIKCVFVESE